MAIFSALSIGATALSGISGYMNGKQNAANARAMGEYNAAVEATNQANRKTAFDYNTEVLGVQDEIDEQLYRFRAMELERERKFQVGQGMKKVRATEGQFAASGGNLSPDVLAAIVAEQQHAINHLHTQFESKKALLAFEEDVREVSLTMQKEQRRFQFAIGEQASALRAEDSLNTAAMQASAYRQQGTAALLTSASNIARVASDAGWFDSLLEPSTESPPSSNYSKSSPAPTDPYKPLWERGTATPTDPYKPIWQT